MEFPELGTNCSWPSCKALDFLPFSCTFCKQIFCKDHFNSNSHECPEVKDGNSQGGEIKLFTCTFEDCKSVAPVEMICPKCEKHFCLEHRFHSCFNTTEEELDERRVVWNAPKEQFKESIKEVNTIVNKGIEKAKQNPKKQQTALKVQLMRLKGKSKGSSGIPTTDRLYFLILTPKNGKSKACFVSKDWSVGKSVDAISDLCDVVNKNNEMKAPKLRLFKKVDGTQISTDMSTLMSDLITNNVFANGESLILEYVSPEENLENFILQNFEEYTETDF